MNLIVWLCEVPSDILWSPKWYLSRKNCIRMHIIKKKLFGNWTNVTRLMTIACIFFWRHFIDQGCMWQGPVNVPVGEGKRCTSPQPKLRYQSLSHLINIHEQIKQRHWCKQRHVPCARMRFSPKQMFRLAECYVPRWTLQCSPGNIEILSLRFFKMRLNYITVCKNIPAWKYNKKILSILLCRQNIWHFQTISIFLMRIWWLVQL